MRRNVYILLCLLLIITFLTGCSNDILRKGGGVALLWKMFDDNGNGVNINSAPAKVIGVNGIVVFKQNNPAPIRTAPSYNQLNIEFYKDENGSVPDVKVTLDSNYYYIANNLGFHPAKTLVKNGTVVIGTFKNKKQDLNDQIKKLEIRQKIVIDLINNKTDCTTMKVFQKEKTIERQFLTGTPVGIMENDLNVVPMTGVIELTDKITDCTSLDIDKINDFLNAEFIEIVMKRNNSDIETCITKHLSKFGTLDDVSDLDTVYMKNNVSELPDNDISDDLIEHINNIMNNIESVNEKIDERNILIISSSSNSITLKNSEDYETFTVKMKKNGSDSKLTLQITEGILFMDNNTENAGVTLKKINNKEYRLEFSSLSDGIYNILVYIEGALTQKEINYISYLPAEFIVNNPVLTDENITLDGNAKIRITWQDSVDSVDHYEILGKVGSKPSADDVIVSNIPVGIQQKEFEFLAGGKLNLAVAAVTPEGTKRICTSLDSEISLNVKVSFPDSGMETLVRYYGDLAETGDIFIDDCLKIDFFSTLKFPENGYPLIDDIADFDICDNNPLNQLLPIYDNENFSMDDMIVLCEDITGLNYLRNVKELILFDLKLLTVSAPNKIFTKSIKKSSVLKTEALEPLQGLDGIYAMNKLQNFMTVYYVSPFDLDLINCKSNIKNFISVVSNYQNYSKLTEFDQLDFLLVYNEEGYGDTEAFIDSFQNIDSITKFILMGDFSNINNLENLAFLSNLESLILYGDNLSDILFIENMHNLKFLSLECNSISDITPLKDLDLEVLSLKENKITDFTPLIENLNLKDSNAKIFLDVDEIPGSTTLDDITSHIGTEPINMPYFDYIFE